MKILKSILFFPLLWLRGLFIRIGRIIAGLFLFGAIGGFFMGDLPVTLPIVCGVMSFALFMLCEFYDWLLLKLNPTNTVYILD